MDKKPEDNIVYEIALIPAGKIIGAINEQITLNERHLKRLEEARARYSTGTSHYVFLTWQIAQYQEQVYLMKNLLQGKTVPCS